MKKEDFKFDRKETPENHEDYWFKISGDSQKELTDKYMEQSIVSVTECVYSMDEDIVEVKKLFPFNEYCSLVDPDNDDGLKDILKSIVEELK